MAGREDIFAGGPERAAEKMLALIEPWTGRGRPVFRADDAALLVLDMQGFFLDPGSHAFIPGAPRIVPAVRALAQAFLARGRKVIFTRHTNAPDDAGMMASWWRRLLEPGSHLSGIAAELADLAGEVLGKTRYDAFIGTDLEERLGQAGIRRLVLTGVMTHLCVETTARTAFCRDFEVYVPADAVATYDRELQAGSLRAMAHGFAVPTLSRLIIEEVEG